MFCVFQEADQGGSDVGRMTGRAAWGRRGTRMVAVGGAVVALLAGSLALAGPGGVSAQEAPDCDATSLGTLGATPDSVLQADGRWTTEDCESRFRPGSDAHTFSFEVLSPGRVRIELASPEADPYLYLLAGDGTRLADNDDGGAGLTSRVERDLEPGVYLLEATTVGGRGRGAADFTLTVGRVAGCEIVNLGALAPGADLTAEGSWSLNTCGSRIVASHPAYNYTFTLPADGRVRIDLESENGDPVLSLAALDGGVIGANDDGGEFRNSRIEQYLPAGVYFIEATTYLTRDLQPLRADFTLTVHLVDEVARQQQDFRIKVEGVGLPDEVIAGDPLVVNYRVGNAGGGDLPGGNFTYAYVVGRAEGGRRVIDINAPIFRRWPAGASYHSDAGLASATSGANPGLRPLEITFDTSGPAWLFLGIFTEDADENELGFHGVWNNLTVLSGPTFDPVEVEVDGTAYQVSAEADEEGTVTTSVTPVADPEAEVDEATRAKAIYAAGVRTQLLDGLFERPAVAALAEEADADAAPHAVQPANPSSDSLLEAVGARYAGAVSTSGLPGAAAAGEAINPVTLEGVTLALAASAAGEYAYLADSWSALAERAAAGEPLPFGEALALHSQLGYAEAVLAPAVTAGEIVTAARAAEQGWDDPEVRAMAAGLATCSPGESALRGALESTDADVDGLLALDAELRAALPVWGRATDAALCAAEGADGENSRFLERLAIDGSEELNELLLSEAPEPPPHRLRIIARLGDDGRIEHGIELAGERILPSGRYLDAGAPAGVWQETGDVEVDGTPLGRVSARRLADGRVEMAFRAGGELIEPEIRYLPADVPVGVWFRSGEIEVPAVS